ncbi:heme ABC transporter ATP-binding protein [Burkholderia plantarii]|uniref:heme ABC transporter ATP-binding protein n=1 Tax=Burkholderia plantarii TaxID=41899 RepID=UPI0006D8C584|nr:heme ABC transporter ATP-binding protein [Burkholderia plantarii]ALK35017.1 hemin importer ATP-binding subunit [Burkholderia plantarii]GLZ19102.1 hemin import ATP-binding protein HmuV [Burkholderia plantarii]
MLIAQHLSIARGHHAVLHGLSLQLAPGSVTALLGRNGAGKSTLLKALAGEFHGVGAPRRVRVGGSVTLNGTPLDKLRAATLARLRAVLPQAAQPAFPFVADELVLLGRYPHARPGGALAARDHEVAQRALTLAGAATLAGRDVTTLSGGELARVQFARALAQIWPDDDLRHPEDAPRYLLLDEPTAALDLAHQHHLLATVRELARDWRLGVLTIVHDPNLAARHADRVALLADGGLLAEGAPADVMQPALIERCFGFTVKMIDVGGGAPPVMVPA